MSKPSEEMIELIKKQIRIENEHVKRLTELEKKVDTHAARLLLMEMRLDSQKHASILGSILKVLETASATQNLWNYKLESYVDKLATKNELEKHVQMELDNLKLIEDAMRRTKDEGLKLMMQHIADDEKKHHQILETIVKYSYKISG